MRNLIATLMLSQGVPMILGGDEFLRTQHGNNNAWCQDNPISWVDWSLREQNAGFLRFVRMMIALRKAHPVLRRRYVFHGRTRRMPPEIIWHGIEPAKPDFSHYSPSLAWALDGRRSDRPNVVDRDIYVAMNAWYRTARIHDPGRPVGPPLALHGRHGSLPLARETSWRKIRAALPCCRSIACRPTR